MIYIKSFLRRLKIKSSCYFSILFGFIYLLFTGSPEGAFLFFTTSVLVLYSLSNLINYFDKKKETHISCSLCGFAHCTLLYPSRRRTNQKNTQGDFACSSFDNALYPDIYYCPECHNGFLKDVYKKQGDTKVYEDVKDYEYLNNIDARYLTNQKLVKKYVNFIQDKDILEIGCYYGAFLSQVQQSCKSYVGVEPSKHAVEYLHKTYPTVSTIQGTLEHAVSEQKVSQRNFDTIILWDVIEHVPNPIQTLKLIHSLLRDGGHVIFSTINIESSFSLALGPMWPWFMDMHYYYFSDRGYIDILHRSGFVQLKHNHFSYFVNLCYFIDKVVSMIIPNFRLPKSINKKLKIPIKITFGDTVAIVGKKEFE